MRIRSERDYVIKIIDYKGNLLSAFRPPRNSKDAYKAMIALARLYERAKKNNFLTKDLFTAIKTYAHALYNKESALRLALKSPALLKHIKEIMNTPIEEFEEEIIYGKVREKKDAFCAICRVHLVYPAYVVFKKDGREIKRSNAIGIKCLNQLAERLLEHAQIVQGTHRKKLNNLVEKIEVKWDEIKKYTLSINDDNNKTTTKEDIGSVDISPKKLHQLHLF